MSKFNQYLTYTAIVEEGSLTGAAKARLMSTSAVSKQLAALESELGVCLVERSTHSVAITPQGNRFYQHCRDILSAIRDLEQEMQHEHSAPQGKLRLSIAPGLLNIPFFQLLQQFVSLNPGIRFDVRLSGDCQDLLDHQVDFAFHVGALEDPRLKAILLADLALYVCAAPAYLQRFPSLTFSEVLSGQHLIIPGFVDAGIVGQILGASGSVAGGGNRVQGLQPFHFTDSAVAYDEMLLAGLGVAICPDITVLESIQKGKVVQLFPEQAFDPVGLYLLHSHRQHIPENMRVFKAFIQNELPRLIASARKGLA